jgi:hypothetical protein
MLLRSIKLRWQVTAAIAAAALLAAGLAALPLLNPGSAGLAGAQEQATIASERAAERRALEARRTELTARAILPGSALPCLDALAGALVESACEQAVFATPSSLAAAVSYAAERLRLLADGVAYARRLDASYEANLADLRIAVENDAYGIYAHVLARDGCTPERCAAFDLLRDTTTLKVHLRQRVYAAYLAQHGERWGLGTRLAVSSVPAWTATIAPPPIPRARPTPAVAARTDTEPVPAPPATAAAASAESGIPATQARRVVPPAASILPNIEFPSADSIPPVSIMAAEPKLSPTAAEPAAPPSAAPKSSPSPQ